MHNLLCYFSVTSTLMCLPDNHPYEDDIVKKNTKKRFLYFFNTFGCFNIYLFNDALYLINKNLIRIIKMHLSFFKDIT